MNPDETYVFGGFDSGGFHGTNANLKWVKIGLGELLL